MKTCILCGISRPQSEYLKQRGNRDGLKQTCKPCQRHKAEEARNLIVEKTCIMCKTIKSSSSFYRMLKSPDGLFARCKTCFSVGNNPRSAAYKQAHPDKKRAWDRKADQKRPEWSRKKANLRRAQWQRENGIRRAFNQMKRVARVKGAVISDLTIDQWLAIKRRYSDRCAYCGCKPKVISMDHVIPLARGGNHTASNIVPACLPCNIKKGAKDATDFQSMLLL
jgi:5-methylcytosine-specific restriction endonuclease McrA